MAWCTLWLPHGFTSDVDPHWLYTDPDPQKLMNDSRSGPDPGQNNPKIDLKPAFISPEKNIFSNLRLAAFLDLNLKI